MREHSVVHYLPGCEVNAWSHESLHPKSRSRILGPLSRRTALQPLARWRMARSLVAHGFRRGDRLRRDNQIAWDYADGFVMELIATAS